MISNRLCITIVPVECLPPFDLINAEFRAGISKAISCALHEEIEVDLVENR